MKKVLLIIFFFHMLGVIFLLHELGFRFNFTDSMPFGIYQIVPGKPKRGELITFQLTKKNPYFKIAIARKYLGTTGCTPLLKTLAGLPGDQLSFSDNGIIINSTPLSNTKIRTSDSCGRDLPSFLNSQIIPANKALALSTYDKNSFDGRYFGLISINQIQRVIPILTFSLEDII